MPMTYKVDEKIPKFKFPTCFLKSIESILSAYKDSVTELEKLTKNPDSYIDESYGVCNNRYKIRYITPEDITTFVSYVGRIVTDSPISVENANDMEALSVAMIQRFVNDNEKCLPFEDTNAYGANANFDQRNIDMAKLVIMCANEFYDTSVYSKSDMIKRVDAIKPDVKLMLDMKFDTKVTKLIDGMPNILEDNIPNIKYDLKSRRLIADIISKFIQTVCVINLITLEQMAAYCFPNKSFNVIKKTYNPNKRYDYDFYNEEITIEDEIDEDDEFIGESVDLTKAKPVFINLSVGGDNFVSKSIRTVTGEEYSHSSIGFDVQLNKLYTFNGGIFHDDVYHWQKAGFQLEALRSSKYKGIRCTVYCVLVPNEVYDKMLEAAQKMEVSNAKYDYKAIVSKAFAKKSDNPARTDKQKKQICSSFVNAIIAIAGNPLGDKEISSPGELGEAALVKPRQLFCVYDGPGDGYDPKLAQEKIKDFAKRPSTKVYGDKQISEQVVECYTECCLVKTNDIRIRSKIPFNCNMRDVVLQDLRPDFKDTESALMFMITDERSPITGLVRKYRTIEKIQPTFRVLNMFMHLRDAYPSFEVKDSDPYYLQNEIGKMHTDPNWLDKITYGNQFLDGNYRSDALGNNKFSPMEDTLNHLYAMYCGCGLKTNEDLANHIVEVSNAMSGIIREYRSGTNGKVYNWEMLRDILAVLGEILTRTMLKLYDNNSIVFTISDTMDNSAAPSYMYTESFDMFMEDAGPSIKVDTNKTGAAKAFANARQLIQNFIQWFRDKFVNTPANFDSRYAQQIAYANSDPDKINESVADAISKGFTINLTEWPKYNVQVKAFDNIKIDQLIMQDNSKIANPKTGSTSNNRASAESMVLAIANELAQKGGAAFKNCASTSTPPDGSNSLYKAIVSNIINCYMYGADNPVIEKGPKPMTVDDWNTMVNDIKSTSDAVKKTVEGIKNAFAGALKKAEENVKQVANNNRRQIDAQSGEYTGDRTTILATYQNPSDTTNWDEVAKNITQVTNDLAQGLTDAMQKFFEFNYKFYVDIIKKYKTMYDSSKPGNPQAQTQNANQKSTNPTQV